MWFRPSALVWHLAVQLILKRVVVAFRRAFKRNDKIVAVGLAKFIAHLVNYQVHGVH